MPLFSVFGFKARPVSMYVVSSRHSSITMLERGAEELLAPFAPGIWGKRSERETDNLEADFQDLQLINGRFTTIYSHFEVLNRFKSYDAKRKYFHFGGFVNLKKKELIFGVFSLRFCVLCAFVF